MKKCKAGYENCEIAMNQEYEELKERVVSFEGYKEEGWP